MPQLFCHLTVPATCLSHTVLILPQKPPLEPAFHNHAGSTENNLMACFADLDRSAGVKLGVAGKIMSAEQAQDCLSQGMDFVPPTTS